MNKKIVLAMCMMSNLWGAGVDSPTNWNFANLFETKEPYVCSCYIEWDHLVSDMKLWLDRYDDDRAGSKIPFDSKQHFKVVFRLRQYPWRPLEYGVHIKEADELQSLEGIGELLVFAKSCLKDKFKDMPRTYLGIVFTGVDSIPSHIFRVCSSLTELNLSNNKIKTFGKKTFSDLPCLTYLDLSNNKIEQLPNDVFVGLEKLEKLNLRDNNIASVGKGEALRPLKNLVFLWLAYNKIEQFPPCHIPSNCLHTLDLRNNLLELTEEEESALQEKCKFLRLVK